MAERAAPVCLRFAWQGAERYVGSSRLAGHPVTALTCIGESPFLKSGSFTLDVGPVPLIDTSQIAPGF